jgi:hypothetical protein
MADHPDVYADGITITVNPAGITLSFTRSEPATPGVSETASIEIAARVRLGRPMAEGLRDLLQRALATQPGTSEQTITH